MTDLNSIRRTALLGSAVVIGYHIAGVVFESSQTVSGVAFSLTRPFLVPIGIQIFAIFAAWRYWLHAVALSETPSQARKLVIETTETAKQRMDQETSRDKVRRDAYDAFLLSLHKEGGESVHLFYDGASSEEDLAAWKARVSRAFPSMSGDREFVSSSINGLYATRLDAISERLCRLLDVDHWAPIWANGLALLLSIASLL